MIQILWEYRVRPERRAEFESHYGVGGTWARFFRKDPAYHGTLLVRDHAAADRYLTIDSWDTLAAYESFSHRHAGEYRAIDALCAAYTLEERRLGIFEAV